MRHGKQNLTLAFMLSGLGHHQYDKVHLCLKQNVNLAFKCKGQVHSVNAL